MDMLVFNVDHQIIRRIDDFKPVADSKNYLKAKFIFTEEWKDDILATFGYNGKYYNLNIENGECLIPWEVIKTPYFTLSLSCGDLITSNVTSVRVFPSGVIKGEIPGTPSPTVWQQYLDKIKEIMAERGVFTSVSDEFLIDDNKTLNIKNISIDKISQDGNKYIVLNCGNSRENIKEVADEKL